MIETYAYLSIVLIVYVKLEMVEQELSRAMYLHVPTGNVTVLEAGCAAAPRHVHGLDDPANLVVHMIQHYMYSAWLNI